MEKTARVHTNPDSGKAAGAVVGRPRRRRHRAGTKNLPLFLKKRLSHPFLSPNPDFGPEILKIWTYHSRSYEIQIKKRFTSSLRFLRGSGTTWLVTAVRRVGLTVVVRDSYSWPCCVQFVLVSVPFVCVVCMEGRWRVFALLMVLLCCAILDPLQVYAVQFSVPNVRVWRFLL